MKKKAMIFLTAAAMLLGLTACGAAGGDTKEEQIAQLEERVRQLEAGNQELRARNEELAAENQELEEEGEALLQQAAEETQTEEAQPAVPKEEAPPESASDINMSNAEDFGACGDGLTWMYANHILLIQGSGDMQFAPWVANYRNEIRTLVVEGGCTSLIPFFGYENLTKVELPDTLEYLGDSAFLDCVNLTEITIPDSVTGIGEGAFSGCTGLTGITIPDSVTSIGSAAFTGCAGLTGIIIPEGVEYIYMDAFYNCENLAHVTIPDSVTLIDEDAFTMCPALTEVAIPNGDLSISCYAFDKGDRVTIGDQEILWDQSNDWYDGDWSNQEW